MALRPSSSGVIGSLVIRNHQAPPYHGAPVTVILQQEKRQALAWKGGLHPLSGCKVLGTTLSVGRTPSTICKMWSDPQNLGKAIT